MEIERALSTHDGHAVRNLILQAQDGVLALERENETLAIENAGLRRRIDEYQRSPLPLLSPTGRPAAQVRGSEAPAPSIFEEDPDIEPKLLVWHTNHFFFT
jgi:hypothetical protein